MPLAPVGREEEDKYEEEKEEKLPCAVVACGASRGCIHVGLGEGMERREALAGGMGAGSRQGARGRQQSHNEERGTFEGRFEQPSGTRLQFA